MGRRLIGLLSALAFLAAGISGCGEPAAPVDDGSIGISGRVTLATTGAGLVQVSLTLFGSGSANVYTDFNGFYRFSGLGDGTYTIVPVKTGYTFLQPTLTVTISGASLTDQNFLAYDVPPPAPAPLPPGEGAPPAGAQRITAGRTAGLPVAPEPLAVE